jgi:two-component system nitrate/nitrite sensor histidine kinase NarX
MRSHRTLASKLLATGLAFLLVALGSIALTLWVTWKLEGGAAAVNEAGRLRMMSYRLALDAANGNADTLAGQTATMDATIALLRSGDPSRPLFVPWTDDAHTRLDVVERKWSSLRSRFVGRGTTVPSSEVAAFVADVDGFVDAIETRLSHWTEVLRVFQLTMVALAIGGAVLMLYTTHLMVLAPLKRLGEGLAAIRAGNFGMRIEGTANDEFGELAAGFNAMATRLFDLYRGLEARVEEKTAKLEVKRERLATLYEVSAFVAQADSLEALARGFAQKIRRIARADAVAVRWSDEGNQRYLLLAQEGLPPALVADEQCLGAGTCHCGRRGAEPHVRVVPIVADNAGLGHCRRAGFATLATVPVVLHQRMLGEIDLLYRDAHALDDDDRSLVETLASHLAGGIESLRAIAAEKEAAVAGERSLLAQELHDSIAQSLAFLKMQVGLLREALRRGDEVATQRTIGEIDAGVRESYGDVRELLVHFRTRTDSEDIEPALRTTLRKFEHQTGLPVDLVVEGDGVPLPPDEQVQVLHVVQEALSNVRKHAHATSVRVRVRQAPEWRFEVADDGRGFDAAAAGAESQVGLRIMHERAARIGARVDIRSAPGAGTRVTITVPRRGATAAGEAHADSLAGR